MFPVAILAGGLAKRLRPLTETIPKALVDVAGKPFIVRQLNYLREQGLNQIVLCIGYRGDMIRDLVGNGESLGLDIRYSDDGSNLLGTGGALRKAVPMLGDHFFVLYGDSFLPVKFSAVQEAYEKSERMALMTVLKNSNQWDTSNVRFVEGKLIEYNKFAPKADMTYIDYGLGVIASSVLEQCPSNEPFDLADVYKNLSSLGQLLGMEVHERFYEIGSYTGLRETERYFSTMEKI